MLEDQPIAPTKEKVETERKTTDQKMSAVFDAMRKMGYLVAPQQSLAFRDREKHDKLVSSRYMQRDFRTIVAESGDDPDYGPLACAEVALVAKKLTEETYGLPARMIDTLSERWLKDEAGAGQGHVFLEVLDPESQTWQVYNPVTGEKCAWSSDARGQYIHWQAGYQLDLEHKLDIDDKYYRWLEENLSQVPADGIGYEGLYQKTDADKDYFDAMLRMAQEYKKEADSYAR